MPANVTVQTFVNRGDYGKPVYGSARDYQARVTFRTRRVVNTGGEEVVSRGEAWLATVEPISAQDRVILPDGSEPLILSIDQVADEDGPLYTKFYFA